MPTERAPLSDSTMASATSLCLQYASGSPLGINLLQDQEQCRLQQRQPRRPRHYLHLPVVEQMANQLPHQAQHLAMTARFLMALMAGNTPSAAHPTRAGLELTGPKPSRQVISHNVSLSAIETRSVALGCGADPKTYVTSNKRLNHQFQEVAISWPEFWLAAKARVKCRLVQPALPPRTAAPLVVLQHPRSCRTLIHARE
jgi:hypothetical protein